IPCSFAIGAATVQAAFAFQASLTCRGGPCGASLPAAVRQIREVPGIYVGGVSARAAPKIPNGVAAPKAPAKPRTERRDNPCCFVLESPFVTLCLISRVSMVALPKGVAGG